MDALRHETAFFGGRIFGTVLCDSEKRSPTYHRYRSEEPRFVYHRIESNTAHEDGIDVSLMHDIGSRNVRWVTCGSHATLRHPARHSELRPAVPDPCSTRASNSASNKRLSDHLRLANPRDPDIGISHRQFRVSRSASSVYICWRLLQLGCSSEPTSTTSAPTVVTKLQHTRYLPFPWASNLSVVS